jgi:hypothetical protein
MIQAFNIKAMLESENGATAWIPLFVRIFQSISFELGLENQNLERICSNLFLNRAKKGTLERFSFAVSYILNSNIAVMLSNNKMTETI